MHGDFEDAVLLVIRWGSKSVRLLGAIWSRVAIVVLLAIYSQVLVAEPGARPLDDMAASHVKEPAGYRMGNYRSPVPQTLAGGEVLTAAQAEVLWRNREGVFIDVFPKPPKPSNLPEGTFWRDPEHQTIEGARWVPNVGYGVLSDEAARYFKANLEKLSAGRRDARLVFFCLKNCWMSWNAAKRALEFGYTHVAWFRDGTDGWQELGHPLVKVIAEP